MSAYDKSENVKNIIDTFIYYFVNEGFCTGYISYETQRVSLLHGDGRIVDMFVSGTGLDFTIKGYNFIVNKQNINNK